MALAFSTSAVVDGVCYGYVIWKSRFSALIHGIWNFITFHVMVIIIFVFCYGRILVVIRRQARVMAGHGGPGSSTGQRPWIKHRSDPLASDPVQRHQNNDLRQRFLLHLDNRGVPKFKSRSSDLGHDPFWPIFYFFIGLVFLARDPATNF